MKYHEPLPQRSSPAALSDSGLEADRPAPVEVGRPAIIELARQQHQEEGVVEIDDDARLREGDDNGCYVQAWVWVDFSALASR